MTPTIQVSENKVLTITMPLNEAKFVKTNIESVDNFMSRMSHLIVTAVRKRREHCYKQLLENITSVSYDGYAIRWNGGHFSPQAFKAMDEIISDSLALSFGWLKHPQHVIQVIKALSCEGCPGDLNPRDWERLMGILTEELAMAFQQRP